MGNLAAHHAAVGSDCNHGQAAALVDAEVGVVVGLVDLLKSFLVLVEAVAVLHGELAYADEARSGSGVVAPLGLELVNKKREPLVGIYDVASEVGCAFLMGHGKDHVPVVAVLEAAHFPVDAVESAGLFPEVAGVDHGHQDLLCAELVHFIADDGRDLLDGSVSEGKKREDTGGQLVDVSRSEKVFVTLAVGSVGGFAEGS